MTDKTLATAMVLAVLGEWLVIGLICLLRVRKSRKTTSVDVNKIESEVESE